MYFQNIKNNFMTKIRIKMNQLIQSKKFGWKIKVNNKINLKKITNIYSKPESNF